MKYIVFVFLTLFWIVVLYPKDILWDSFENAIEKKGISIHAKEVDLNLFLLYNKIDIKEVLIANSFNLQNVVAQYDFRNPLHVKIIGKSEFGDFTGKIILFENKGFILLKEKSLNNNIIKKYFKKTKEGMKYEFDY